MVNFQYHFLRFAVFCVLFMCLFTFALRPSLPPLRQCCVSLLKTQHSIKTFRFLYHFRRFRILCALFMSLFTFDLRPSLPLFRQYCVHLLKLQHSNKRDAPVIFPQQSHGFGRFSLSANWNRASVSLAANRRMEATHTMFICLFNLLIDLHANISTCLCICFCC